MEQILKEQCDLFIANKKVIKDSFRMDYDIMLDICAAMFSAENVKVEKEKIEECKKILKSKTSIFSEFRGHTKLIMITKMAMSDDPEQYFDDVRNVYDKIPSVSIGGSDYRILTAMEICDNCEIEKQEEYIDKTMALYKKMKKEHPFLTSNEDVPLAALLSFTNKDVEALVDDMEKSYTIMREKFKWSDNAVQSLSHALALEDSLPEDKCSKVSSLYDELLNNDLRYGKNFELAVLGVLIELGMTNAEIVAAMKDTDEILKKEKGFGVLGTGSTGRLLFAAIIVMNAYAMDKKKNNSIIAAGVGVEMVIAQEIAMMIIISSTSAAIIAASN